MPVRGGPVEIGVVHRRRGEPSLPRSGGSGADVAAIAERLPARSRRVTPVVEASPTPFALLESKLAPPRLRDGTIPRVELVSRLRPRPPANVSLVVAPAGYGKTTLLSEWTRAERRQCSWISLATQPARDAARAAAHLLASGPQLLVVDDAHLADPPALRRLLLAGAALPEGSTLALASRRPLGEPLG